MAKPKRTISKRTYSNLQTLFFIPNLVNTPHTLQKFFIQSSKNKKIKTKSIHTNKNVLKLDNFLI
ncbi:hypothetical protein HPMG_00351 [Helicobacter pullorum MIT 98-5489]|uniref:Uncharacterized protein n=1 Tax=Helicobacter pullorum MIT 98-5489 TaxID=537972 RepID=C5EYC4_9HELI|nr:hypothetical protein HPMG_00351 [Helicobacter pullorum MIT 98-5489]